MINTMYVNTFAQYAIALKILIDYAIYTLNVKFSIKYTKSC